LLSALPVKILAKEKNLNPGRWFIDAHAHPYSFYRNQPNPDEHTFEMIREAGIVATSIAAVGDYANYSTDPSGSAYEDTLRQLAIVEDWEDQGHIKIIRKPQEIRRRFEPDAPISAILTIEGGDALEGDLDRLDEFYEMGVRMITLVHNDNNEIGNDMRQFASNDPNDSGLTDFGYSVVERMNELGILIDVAHSSAHTVFDVAEYSRAPIIDSHTNPLPPFVANRGPGRLRTYTEIEAIVKTGGVLCTWPLAYTGTFSRQTFEDWTQEIKEFKNHFGISHVGLGTDGGGGLPEYIEGWNDITDLNLLEEAMLEESFEEREIAAFLGDNILKVLHRCFVVSQVLKGRKKLN
jgi:microsomal dipeptidase-like Zn-dependent dipeptidase